MSTFARDIHGNILFERSKGVNHATPLTAVDALTIGEVHAPVKGVAGLEPVRKIVLSNGDKRWAKYIITTPNATWLPNIANTRLDVRTRIDGWYGDHDFTQWPQWYFEDTRHLAFVPSKPTNLSEHPHAVLWHSLKTSDFNYEPGAVFTDLGKISDDLFEAVMDVRQYLTQEIVAALQLPNFVTTPIQRYILDKSVTNMQLGSVCLTVAPQRFFATLCTFTLFQHYALEAWGCLDLVTRWSKAKARADGRFVAPLNVERPVVGAITFNPEVAIDLASLGVPVWLVRPPHAISLSIKIVNTTDPIGLAEAGLVSTNTQDQDSIKYSARPTPARNRACVCLRLGHLHLAAYTGLESAHPFVNPSLTSAPATQPVPYNALTAARSDLPIFAHIDGAKRPGINDKKFKEPDADVWPGVVPTWRLALEGCTPNWKHAYSHPDSNLLRRYALMDPYLIARPGSAGDLALVVWLFIRSAWISTVATQWNSREPFPSPQEWRTYVAHVGAKIGYVWGSGSAAVNAANKVLAPDVAAKFPIPLPLSPCTIDLYWRGNVVVTAADLNSGRVQLLERVREEIIFDLYEQNFRVKLISLDRMEAFQGHMTEEAADSRDQLVTSFFPRGVVVTSDLADECLGIRHNKLRAVQVNNLRRLMTGWGGACASLLRDEFRAIGSPQITDAEIFRIEKHIFSLYCERFFKFFCRAPTIPHVCPEARH